MKKNLLAFLMLFFSLSSFAQKATLSGYVKDAANGEALIGVSIFSESPRMGTVTNAYGFYSLSMPLGSYQIKVSYLGYATETKSINLQKNTTLNIGLKEESAQLNEVVVTGKRLDDNLTKTEMSVAELSGKEIQKIPQFLGEVDVIRTLILLPGVSTVGEGANGFNVRGGNVDQNLILLDDAPIFSSSHLFGFFSIFNGDAVKDVKLYKGGMPANYGGRLSSVLDVRQIDGSSKKLGASGGLGILSSRLLVEGPILKDKITFMVAGRRSYQDVFFGLSKREEIKNTAIHFFDLNGKLAYDINPRNKVYLSAYYGRDVFSAQDLFDFGWGNGTVSGRWNFLINPKLFLNATSVYSDYTYNLGTPNEGDVTFRWKSRIRNYVEKFAFTYYANTRHRLDFGAEATYYRFDPGTISGTIAVQLQSEYALEPAIYIADEYILSDEITINGGVRYSWFYNFGARTIQFYQPGHPLTSDTKIGSQAYGKGEIIQSYAGLAGLEPRLAMNYKVNKLSSLKLSYNRNRQYIHLISNGTTPTPIDVWRPAGKYIQPATVDQVATGYFRNFKEGTYTLSAEVCYKKFQDLVDYKNGANLIFEDHIETELLMGRGRAYGLELMFEKQVGDFTGWISYTLSRTERQVDKGPDPAEWINNGLWYRANYDKPHDISLVGVYNINKQWDVSANFVYQTGRPMTPPESKGVFEGIAYPVTITRNTKRIPDYHRLDIAANYHFKKNENRRWQSSLNIGVYNVYARRNAYSVFFRQNRDSGLTEAVRLSIFARAIPSITWNFNF